MFKRHPNTTFINAHLGWLAHDLERLGKHLDEHPNVVTEFGVVIAELGRQPIAARKFMIKYQDRIMFGKDTYKKRNIIYTFGFWKLMMSILITLEKDMHFGKCMA